MERWWQTALEALNVQVSTFTPLGRNYTTGIGHRNAVDHYKRGTAMYVEPLFRNREEAGQRLGDRLARIVDDPDLQVLALPRGGVPVGLQVARILNADLDVFLVRKLGVPGHEELAMGAIASGGVRVLNHELIARLGIPPAVVERVAATEQVEITRRE